MRLKLLILAVLTALTGAFLVFVAVAQANAPGHVKQNIHSAVYRHPHANPTRIA